MNSKIALKQLKEIKKLIDKIDKPRLVADGWDSDWKTLISIILSAQTRDSVTILVCENLFKKYKTPKSLSEEKLNKLEKEIKSVNYHKSKAKHVKETSKLILEGASLETIEELIKLPGVGRKTANVFLAEAKKVPTIGVDTHVARVSKKLGWTSRKQEDREGIEKDLKELFPKRHWSSINFTIVTFGQTYGRRQKVEDEIIKEIKKIYFD